MSEKEETALEATEEVEEKPEEVMKLRGKVCSITEEGEKCTPFETKYVKGELSRITFFLGEAEEELEEEEVEEEKEAEEKTEEEKKEAQTETEVKQE